jgi:hypothetical protein
VIGNDIGHNFGCRAGEAGRAGGSRLKDGRELDAGNGGQLELCDWLAGKPAAAAHDAADWPPAFQVGDRGAYLSEYVLQGHPPPQSRIGSYLGPHPALDAEGSLERWIRGWNLRRLSIQMSPVLRCALHGREDLAENDAGAEAA